MRRTLLRGRGGSFIGSSSIQKCFSTGAIVGIDNHRGIFPIHRSVRFLLVTASAGPPTGTIACRLDLDDPADLESLGEEPARGSGWFPVAVTPGLLERLSGPGLEIPSLRD